MTTTEDRKAVARPPFWRDIRVIRIVGQILAVAIVFFLLRYFYTNLLDNFDRLGISTSFEFLKSPTNFRIPYDESFDPSSPVWKMVLVGIKNTFLAGFFGVIIATIVGLIVGVSRLSDNWLVNKAAMVYVETFRNIPPLVIIIFFASAIFFFGPFPIFSQSWEINFFGTDNVFLILNRDKWGVPGFTEVGNLTLFWIAMLVGIVAAVVVWRWRTKRFDATGEPHHRVLWGGAVLLLIAVIGYFVAGQPFEISWPVISEDGRLLLGGFAINWGFISVTVALGLYTASHLAEILRGSILAVHGGQSEAANALALTGFQRYRFVILPQAMRIAIPPTINQYLNLVKNTSLGTAAAYAEITALTKTSIGNGRPTFQSVMILAAVYLSFSLVISFVLNIVNRRLQIVDR
jgi:general L-amino acid transport system permease protein